MQWVQLIDFPNYEINTHGEIRRIDTLLIIKQKLYKGYMILNLSVNGKKHTKSVHRLVAMTFISNPYSLPEVDHIDRNKTNNHVTNLRWTDHKGNCNNRTFGKTCIVQDSITGLWEVYKKNNPHMIGSYSRVEEALVALNT